MIAYKQLARLNCTIVFGIDGLEDTNHLYRQGVKWNNLMDRVQTFISEGGKANWQFIPFEHNKHQIHDAKKLSEKTNTGGIIIDQPIQKNRSLPEKARTVFGLPFTYSKCGIICPTPEI